MRRLVLFLALSFSLVSLAAPAQSIRREPGRGRGAGWRQYPEHGCIGGSECKQYGRRISIALDGAPVLGVRFFAHDNIGQRADGKVTVRIDDTTVAAYVDVQRNGSRHEFDVDGVRGRKLVIEAANDDEIEVRDIEVLYGRDEYRRRNGDGDDEHEYRDHPRRRGEFVFGEEGGCIGGSECGGRRARIEVSLRDRRVRTIRFYAHDDVGARAGGRLRISIDDHVIADGVDVERDGNEYSFDARGLRGDYLVIEPVTDDEVVVKNVRVRYE